MDSVACKHKRIVPALAAIPRIRWFDESSRPESLCAQVRNLLLPRRFASLGAVRWHDQLREDLFDHVAIDVGQSEITTRVAVRKLLVVQPQKVKHCGV